jgi:arylsulfatase A-like enzyme
LDGQRVADVILNMGEKIQTRRDFLKDLSLGTAATIVPSVILSGCSRRDRHTGKNVILIVIDTARADRFGCYGNPSGITPNIDKFAEDAVLFLNAFSHAPWTLPSLASLFTSQYPSMHGAGGRLGAFKTLNQEAVTLAELCQRAGIITGAIINVVFISEKLGMTQGFHSVDKFIHPSSNVNMRKAGPTTKAALRWIKRHKNSPFFLLVHYFDPHLTYNPPKTFRTRFADPKDRYNTDYIFGTRKDITLFRQNLISLNPEKIARLEKLYNAEIAYVDSEIGRLLDGISRQGLDKNTVIVITSDHGEEFLEHNGFEHGHTLYDELLHVPLIIRDPNIVTENENTHSTKERSPKIHTTVRLIDVAPTLCNLVGIPAASTFVGQSLLPIIENKHKAHLPVLSQGNMWGLSGTALRKDGFKLILQPYLPRVRMFNIGTDPGEQENIEDQMPQKRDKMIADLNRTLKMISRRQMDGAAPQLSQEELQSLRSLGYVK